MRNRLISLALLTTTLIATPLGAQNKVTARIPDVQDAPIAYPVSYTHLTLPTKA